MPDSRNLPKLYDEKEVGAILRRATELGREDPGTAGRGGGTSLSDLEDIAREAGIDPALVRRAAGELESGGIGLRGWDRVFGETSTLVREAEVAGEIPPEAFEDVVNAIEAVVRDHGQPSVLGRTLTWRGENQNRSRMLQVTVTSKDGRTSIRAEEHLRQLAAGVFGGGMGGFGTGIGLGVGLPIGIEVLGSVAFTVAFPVGVLGLSFLGARAVYRHVVGGRRKALADLMAAVDGAVRRAVERADRDRALAEGAGRGRLPS
ncbi:MAG: hypothetical protein RJQ04_07640, partial [Longimicrobiales bacterium]